MLVTSPGGREPSARLLRGRPRAADWPRTAPRRRSCPSRWPSRPRRSRSSTWAHPRAASTARPGGAGPRAAPGRHACALSDLTAPAARGGPGRGGGPPRSRSTCWTSWAPSFAPPPRAPRCTSPNGRPARGGGAGLPGPSGPTCSSASAPKARVPLRRPCGHSVSDWVLSAVACSPAQDLAAYQTQERPRPRPLPRPAGADQPAAVVGRDPDRGRLECCSASTARATPGAGGGDRLDQLCPGLGNPRRVRGTYYARRISSARSR